MNLFNPFDILKKRRKKEEDHYTIEEEGNHTIHERYTKEETKKRKVKS